MFSSRDANVLWLQTTVWMLLLCSLHLQCTASIWCSSSLCSAEQCPTVPPRGGLDKDACTVPLFQMWLSRQRQMSLHQDKSCVLILYYTYIIYILYTHIYDIINTGDTSSVSCSHFTCQASLLKTGNVPAQKMENQLQSLNVFGWWWSILQSVSRQTGGGQIQTHPRGTGKAPW